MKVQQRKWRQRSWDRPDGFQDTPIPIRIFIIDTSSLQHQGQTSWRPLPSSYSYHNSQSLKGLLAPGCPHPLILVSSNHSRLLQLRLMAPRCQRVYSPDVLLPSSVSDVLAEVIATGDQMKHTGNLSRVAKHLVNVSTHVKLCIFNKVSILEEMWILCHFLFK